MSGIPSEIEASAATELEIATAVIFLKARARHFGKDGIPLSVKLSPLAPEAGWRSAAIAWVEGNKRNRQAGLPTNLAERPQPQGYGFLESVKEAL